MGFKPIGKRKRIYQTIIGQIKESIADGSLKPGEKLPSERALAEQFAVSRTSVKEAVTVLESSGIITVRAGVGMFLNEVTQHDLLHKFSQIMDEKGSDFIDLIELRQAIEGDAAYHAACRMTTEQKMKLTNIYHQLLEVEMKGMIALEEDYAFHYAIVESSCNPVMLDMINLVSDKIMANLKESRQHSIKDKDLNQQVMKEHENIFTAIIEKNPEAARKAMWEHHQKIKERHVQSRLTRMGEGI
ncbi:FadR/GntR family transcriptional regulator [Oceanobacillus bengalensis]|uniref:FadR family transcriptional regulator n=1 Tax=Oceanobacillus bengalensis TaxID=1435466 RepID=A0A494YXL4_9BACI|nr:FadR/GntR family transcriptional regulator [Oceanobacillus bengalensis]RKQ14755.1 FadR family transcriptional regulator [Oceanobacillus bengalensis]